MNNLLTQAQKIVVFLSFIFLLQPNLGISQDCTCTEYIYLNETSNGGVVHKYSVAADGTLTQIFNSGNAWYPGGGTSELPSPHGLGSDLNGNLYIGETEAGDIRKLTCEGEIVPESEYVISGDGGYNIGSIGNFLYTNTSSAKEIRKYDLCTGQLVVAQCFEFATNSGQHDWGFFIDPVTGDMYTTYAQVGGAAETNGVIYKYTDADLTGSATCFSTPFIASDDDIVNLGDNELPIGQLRGITTDSAGNIYIVMQNRNGSIVPTLRAGRLLKYDANGNFISATAWDETDSTTDVDGLYFALGIVYSETSNTLFVSRGDPLSNCIQEFDTNLNDLGAAVPPAPTGDISKGIAKNIECCPTDALTTIDTVLCDPNIGDQLFLQDFINCVGSICEGGSFFADPANAGTILNTCNNSIEITGPGCSTFTKGSDGLGAASQCAAFMLTLNVCIDTTPAAPVISITDNTCNPDVAGSINVDTACPAGSTLEFSTDGGNIWSTTQPQYDATNPVTVRARCTSDFGCSSTETADITTTPQECCPPVNCINQFGEFTIIKNEP